MPDVKQFNLPDVGEGLTEADILSWAVAVGDTVVVNQTLVEVETAKAAVELPSPFAGTVTALHVDAGQTVEVGTPIISIDVTGSPATTGDTSTGSAPAATAPSGTAPVEGERQAVLVGYGPRSGPATRRPRRTPHSSATADAPVPTVQSVFTVAPTAADPVPTSLVAMPPSTGATASDGRAIALAKPPVRKLAKQLGVDLTGVEPTGPNGTVSREDVERAAGASTPLPSAAPSVPRSGERETRIPIKGVRKHTAAAMVASAFTAPHVTEFVTCDISATMELRERVAARREFAGVKVSPLLLVARALIWAAGRTPIVNARWDEAAGEIVLRNYVNLGIAAATERGLIVPNVKDADAMSLRELADALGALTETARSGRTSPADMSGGTITITNVGVFGVDTGTPILNPGESAILALGSVARRAWVVERDGVETIEPRWVTQLALSFDHRLVDGEQGSRFLADIAAVLTDPGLALL